MKTKIVSMLLLVCTLFSVSSALSNPGQFRVLMISTTNGWHHDAISEAVPAIRGLAAKHQFELVWEENVDRMFTDDILKDFDVILFALTTGDILNPAQQALMEKFIQSGKGFVGIHSASDTEYEWTWYTQLVGRMFHIHPAIQTGRLSVVNRNFPGAERMPDKFWFTDEFYEFGPDTTDGLNTLLTVDESTYNPVANWSGDGKAGKGMGDVHPMAWYHEFDGGRSFYTALGHLPAVYKDDLFLEHLYGGIYWAATARGIE